MKIFNRSSSDDFTFVTHVVDKLCRCSIYLKTYCPYRVKSAWDISNHPKYIIQLINDMSETYLAIDHEETCTSRLKRSLSPKENENPNNKQPRLSAPDSTSSPSFSFATEGDTDVIEEDEAERDPEEVLGNLDETQEPASPLPTFRPDGRTTQGRRRVVDSSLTCNQSGCRQLNHTFTNRQNLRRHMARFHGAQPSQRFACSQCEKSFPRSDGLLRHRQKSHGLAKGPHGRARRT